MPCVKIALLITLFYYWREDQCSVCGKPDMSSDAIDMDLYLQLFSGLIQTHMNKENYDLFTQELSEHRMIINPNFRWCITVSASMIDT